MYYSIAGGETTATVLTAAFHFLGRDRAAYEKLVAEVRSNFNSIDEITAANCEKLPYLQATINETMRLYPPLVTLGIRESPGADVDGAFVPKGTEVVAPQWVINRNPDNFHDPETFDPERWITENSDKKRASQPFSLGPRQCIGRL